jgi:hypothetical protein
VIDNFEGVLKIADHYNINKDLFSGGNRFFKPTLDLQVEYENANKVYYGNRLQAKNVSFSICKRKWPKSDSNKAKLDTFWLHFVYLNPAILRKTLLKLNFEDHKQANS